MDGTAIVIAGISPVCAIVVAIIQLFAARRQKADAADRKRRQEEYDRRSAETDEWGRRHNDLLQIALHQIRAAGKLSFATAMAYKRGSPNGEMETAIEAWNEYDKEFQEFRDKLGADILNK